MTRCCVIAGRRVVFFRVVCIRAAVLLTGILMGLIGSPYDTSAHFEREETSPRALDALIEATLRPLAAWDGAWFLAIARAGYSHEQCYAFLPGFPFALRLASFLLTPLAPFASAPARALLAGVFLNFCAGVVAALSLRALSRLAGRGRNGNARVPGRDAIAAAATPAGVFFAAVYSEPLFCALTFAGMACLEAAPLRSAARTRVVSGATEEGVRARERGKALPPPGALVGGLDLLLFFSGTALLTAASAVRANGMLGSAFIALAAARGLLSRRGLRSGSQLCADIAHFLAALLPFVPLTVHQWGAWLRLCGRTDAPAWCDARALIPPAPPVYAEVQARYWGVGGPFSRWTVEHAPALALAFPVVVLAASALAFRVIQKSRETARSPRLLAIIATDVLSLDPARPHVLYYAHCTALVALAVVAAHAQIATRLAAAASPVVAWAISDVWAWASEETPARAWGCTRALLRASIMLWIVGYTAVGSALFVNWFNWT